MAPGSRREPESGRARPPKLDPAAMLDVLVRHEVELVVIGAFSLAAHGFVRATKDIDIVSLPTRANLERLLNALTELEAFQRELEDFRPEEIPLELSVENLLGGGNWFLETKLGWLDIMQAVEGVDDYVGLRSRAVERSVSRVSRPLLFASREDLVAMKRAAGRPQDLVDLAHLGVADS